MVSARLLLSVKVVARVAVVSMICGAFIGVLQGAGGPIWEDLVLGGIIGLVISIGCTVLELGFLSNSRLRLSRRLPVAGVMVLRSVGFATVIVLGLNFPFILLGQAPLWDEPRFIATFVMSFLVATGFSISIEITRLLGREATLALLMSRYHRPRLEDRVVLFADLVGSTALGEQLGDLQFHAFIGEVVHDLAIPIGDAKGEVHRYVGDAVIVTWPLESGLKDGRCLVCARDMHARLEQRANAYHKRFAAAPKIRIALHMGSLAVGEIGDWKKEIVLLGDSMNTVSRIEGAARDAEFATVLSADLAQRLPADLQEDLSNWSAVRVAGKEEPLSLFGDLFSKRAV